MSLDLEAMKAAFLAKGGAVQVAPVGIAYGIDAGVDKAKRAAEREEREYRAIEHNAERRAETVREAYHVGGSDAASDALNNWRY